MDSRNKPLGTAAESKPFSIERLPIELVENPPEEQEVFKAMDAAARNCHVASYAYGMSTLLYAENPDEPEAGKQVIPSHYVSTQGPVGLNVTGTLLASCVLSRDSLTAEVTRLSSLAMAIRFVDKRYPIQPGKSARRLAIPERELNNDRFAVEMGEVSRRFSASGLVFVGFAFVSRGWFLPPDVALMQYYAGCPCYLRFLARVLMATALESEGQAGNSLPVEIEAQRFGDAHLSHFTTDEPDAESLEAQIDAINARS